MSGPRQRMAEFPSSGLTTPRRSIRRRSESCTSHRKAKQSPKRKRVVLASSRSIPVRCVSAVAYPSRESECSHQKIYGTVRQHPNGNGVAEQTREHSGDAAQEEIHHDAPSSPPPARPPPLHEEPLVEEPSREEEEAPVVNVNVHTPQPAPPPEPTAPAPDVNEDLVIKLREAQSEIERLRNLISSMPEPSTLAPTTVTNATEFRRRRPISPSDDGSTWDGETEVGTSITGTTTMEDTMMQPDGVPLQVVIIIALGVFVTTYLFF